MQDENNLTVSIPTVEAELDMPITLDPADLERATQWEDFISLWMNTKDIDMRNQWYKGDIAQKVAVTHGETSLSKFAESVGEKRVTVEGYRRISRAFPKDTRTYNLSWTHYFLASYTDSFKKGQGVFDGSERFKWIEKANDEGWSTSRMKEEIKKAGAMVNDQKEFFLYFDEYLSKVHNVLLHIDRKQLTKEQGDQLLAKLKWVYEEFENYLAVI